MKNKILYYLVMPLILAGMFSIQSCTKEVGTITSFGAFLTPALVGPANESFISLSGTTVDLKWSSSDVEGDPNNWDVYFGTSATPPLVVQGLTTETYTATVTKGKTYYWRVIGHDANNIPTRSHVWSFSTIDPSAEFDVTMDWTTDVATAIGVTMAPDKVVDMRLLIVKSSDKSIAAAEDGSSFEEYTDFNSLPDGTYQIAADIYSTINAGDLNKPVSISISLILSQTGIIDETLDFPKVMTNEFPCDAYRTYLATVVKTGTSYTITKDVSYMTPETIAWKGTDATYASEVTTVAGCSLLMKNLGAGWMFDFWGEIVVDGGTLVYTVDAGNITIAEQYYETTTYKGAEQTPYYIKGTGTIDESGAFPVMHLKYDYIQGGTSIGQLCLDYGIWPTNYFEADLNLDPAAKGATKGIIKITPNQEIIRQLHNR